MCKLEGLKPKLTECLEDLPGLLTSVTLLFFFFSSYFNLLAACIAEFCSKGCRGHKSY